MNKNRKIAVIVVCVILVSTGILALVKMFRLTPSTGLPVMEIASVIDSDGNICIIRSDEYGVPYFTKLSPDGKLLINKELRIGFYDNNNYTEIEENKSVEGYNGRAAVLYTDNKTPIKFRMNIPLDRGIAIDSNDCIHFVWYDRGGYLGGRICYIRIDTNGTLLGGKVLAKYGLWPIIAVDHNDYIHVAWSTNTSFLSKYWIYATLDRNGTIVNTSNLIDVIVIPNYPIIETNSNLVYIGENGFVDNDSNIHILRRYRGAGQFIGKSYEKLDANGNVLIKTTFNNSTMYAMGVDSMHHVHILWLSKDYLGYRKVDESGGIIIERDIIYLRDTAWSGLTITIDLNNIYVVWLEIHKGIRFIKLDINGEVLVNKIIPTR